MENVIELKDVWVNYEDTTILESVDLIVRNHDFLAIMGPNGGGKSTLLKVILGLIKPGKGSVKLLGDSPCKTRQYVGYVSQHITSNLDFPISVRDVVLMGRISHAGPFKRYSKEDRQAAYDALNKVDMLEYKDRQINELSGGQKQRVFIARALVNNPRLLLLDEPSAGIDAQRQKDFYELLKKLKEEIAIVMITHDLGAVSVHIDKIACLNKKLHYHDSKNLHAPDLEAVYGCPVDLIAHGIPHRVLEQH